ncbi:MAG TPA: bifunctional histidinol-phosphatase/imidazoleglycerol-phosphate dehydratase HisB [Bacteroidota bacterium]|jgi:imidazoleglycerol-phosphate dehydratase/histidinol-phosphatase
MKKVVFVDRDGTIVVEPRDRQVDSLEKVEFVPGIIGGLRLLVDSGFTLVMVSNQDGLGSRSYPSKSFKLVQAKILGLLAGEGINFERIFVCPHRPAEGCECRKPKIGLVDGYLKRSAVDRNRSFVLGDRETDVQFAENLGLRSVRITPVRSTRATFSTRDGFEACNFIAKSARSATICRSTGETSIRVELALDGSGEYAISTGIGFFDHMLAQLARHSRIDLKVETIGDRNVDEHHTVEDTGIVIGQSLREALGEKRGLERYGFAAPMDEARAEVSIDLSGRSYCSLRCNFRRERVGELPTELVEDFFRAFADGLGATVHISCTGRNDHHKIEAIFKAVANALRYAVRVDRRLLKLLPTTKGTL